MSQISRGPERVKSPRCNSFYSIGILLVLLILYLTRLEGDVSIEQGDFKYSKQYKGEIHTSSTKFIGSLYSTMGRDSLLPEQRPSHRPKLTDEYLDRFIVVPEYRLLFCYQEKVGCSMFNHLFRMLRLLHPNLSDNSNTTEAKFQAETTWFRNTPEHHNLSKSALEDILMDSSWTKALFFRDPSTRFLSAYRSKCVLKERSRGFDHCRDSFGPPRLPWGTVSFDRAVGQLQEHPEQVFGNEHFAPAYTFCGGLDTTLDYYDFVHQLTSPTAQDRIRLLFSILKVDSETADYLMQNVVRTGGTALDRDEKLLRTRYSQDVTLHGSTTQQKGHNTGSNKKSALQDSYRNDRTLQIIYDHYGTDYDLFQLPRLSLEELQKAKV